MFRLGESLCCLIPVSLDILSLLFQNERIENVSDATGENDDTSDLQITQSKEVREDQELRPRRSKVNVKWKVLQNKHASLVASSASEDDNNTLGRTSSTPVGVVDERADDGTMRQLEKHNGTTVTAVAEHGDLMNITGVTVGAAVEANVHGNGYARNYVDTNDQTGSTVDIKLDDDKTQEHKQKGNLRRRLRKQLTKNAESEMRNKENG